jgi:hypothetical protein
MQVIQVSKDRFEKAFTSTLNKLELISKKEGTVNVKLNSQTEVDNFIKQLHRKFHYEVVSLKKELENL